MPALDSNDVRSALKNKLGCQEQSTDHYRDILYDEAGRILATTKVSHGPKHTIGDNLIPKMARQIKLGTTANFVALVRCTKSREDCLAVIKAISSQTP